MAKKPEDNPAPKAGQGITVTFKSCEIQAIVIDPNGISKGRPSVGLEVKTTERCMRVSASTLSKMVSHSDGRSYLPLPCGKTFKVYQLPGEDGNAREVLEVSDCVALAKDWAQHPGKLSRKSQNNLIEFLAWFDTDKFYEQAYKTIKRVYTDKDSRAVWEWQENRGLGIPPRNDYTDLIQKRDGNYGKWTNIIYQGLFDLDAASMKRIWETVAGNPKIARNHIPSAIGLQAVACCERLVVLLGLDDLSEAHTEAIRLTRKKFGFDRQDSAA